MVAGDSGAGARPAAAGGVRGDFDYRGLPSVSSEHLGKVATAFEIFLIILVLVMAAWQRQAKTLGMARDICLVPGGDAGGYIRTELQRGGVAAVGQEAGQVRAEGLEAAATRNSKAPPEGRSRDSDHAGAVSRPVGSLPITASAATPAHRLREFRTSCGVEGGRSVMILPSRKPVARPPAWAQLSTLCTI